MTAPGPVEVGACSMAPDSALIWGSTAAAGSSLAEAVAGWGYAAAAGRGSAKAAEARWADTAEWVLAAGSGRAVAAEETGSAAAAGSDLAKSAGLGWAAGWAEAEVWGSEALG